MPRTLPGVLELSRDRDEGLCNKMNLVIQRYKFIVLFVATIALNLQHGQSEKAGRETKRQVLTWKK